MRLPRLLPKLRFSLRTFFVVLTIVIAPCAWLARERRQSQRESWIVEQLGGHEIVTQPWHTQYFAEDHWWCRTLDAICGPRITEAQVTICPGGRVELVAELDLLRKLGIWR